MTYRIEFTGAAHADLVDIGNYIREHVGDVAADRFVERLIAKAETLRSMPLRHRARPELRPALRAVSVDNYLIFDQVTADIIRVFRVLHGARNITPELFTD